MTREEAKIWLNKLYTRTDITDEYGDMEDMQPYEEALDMAIKALEQEPSITWVTGADGAKIAFWDVPVWKVTKICEILSEPRENEE